MIEIEVAGAYNCDGGAYDFRGDAGAYGGGGGAGGGLKLTYTSFAVAPNCSYSFQGGAGGTAMTNCGAGGDGGAGWYVESAGSK